MVVDLMSAGAEIVEFLTIMRSMVSKLPRILANKWKNHVLLLPSVNQLIIDFCFQ